MYLFKFELLKNLRRKKFLFLFLIIVIFVLGIFYRNILMQNTIAESETLSLLPHFQESNDLIQQLNRHIREDPDNESLKKMLDNSMEMNQVTRDLQNAITNHDWDLVPTIEADFLQAVTTHLNLGGEYKAFQGSELEQTIEKNTILVEHQLPYEHGKYSLSTPNFMKSAATLLMSLIGILLLVFFLGDTLSDELENQTIRTLYTQPIRRWNILLSKYATMMTSVLFVIVIFFLACAFIPWVFGGSKGSFLFPQIVLYPDGFIFISTREYLLKLAILLIGTSSFAFSFALFCSIWFRNRFITLLVVLFALSGGVFITDQLEALQVILNPFYYFGFVEIIERPETNGSFISVLLLFVYSFLLLCFSALAQIRGWYLRERSTGKPPFSNGNTLESKNNFFAIYLFEGRKLWRQSIVKQSIFILALLLVGAYIFLTYETNKKERDFRESMEKIIANIEQTQLPKYENKLQENQSLIKELERKEEMINEKEKAKLEIAKDSVKSIQDLIEEFKYELTQANSVVDAFNKEDWTAFYNYWITENRIQKGESNIFSFNDNRPTERGGLSDFTYKASIAEKELLSEKQIEPVFSPEFLYTIYDRYLNPIDQLEWKREIQKIDNTGVFFVYLFFQSFAYLLLLFLVVFLFGSGFSAEKGRKRTLYFLKTQPISNFKLLIGKYCTSATFSLGATLVFILSMVGIGIIGNRLGDGSYPVLYYDTKNVLDTANYTGITSFEGGFHFISMGRYIVETSLLFFAALLFLLAFSQLISIFTSNTSSFMIITVSLVIGFYFISIIPSISFLAHLSPFTYLNLGKIANGEIATVLNNQSINTLIGITVLLVSTLVVLSVSHHLLKKGFMKRY